MIGAQIGAYRVLSELGSGGMGTVYLAEDAAQGRRVALKVVHPQLLARADFRERFAREVEIGRRVEHANVVRTLDVGTATCGERTLYYLVMEYVEGQTLRALLGEVRRVPEELCRHIGREVARALVAIHGAGVVHRDLKPENVLLTPDHLVKVMDLGVARLADEAIRLSETGVFVGSVLYAAPEQFQGADADARADLYAFGLMLYELATGVHPFRGDDVATVMRRHMREDARPCAELNPQLSPFFEEVVRTLLAKQPEDRFPSAAGLLDAMRHGERSRWWKERARAIRLATDRPLRRIRIPRETALYGREEELARLRHLYDLAAAGNGQAVLLEGEAGIGKTRLVDELVARVRQEDAEVNFLFGSYPPGGAATASGAFSTAYREHFGEAGCRDWLQATPALVPAFDAVLRGEPTPQGAEPLTRESLHTVFIYATRALAAERPTVVFIDDLHLAPEEGRSLFAALALAVHGHRILLIGATRPESLERWMEGLARVDYVTRLPLPRLGPKDLGRLLVDAFRSERLSEELGWQIAQKSDGNPFFVFELLRGLREGRFIERTPDGTWVRTQVIENINIPSSVLDLVRGRIADLAEEDKDLLDVAACCGFTFDPLLVARAIGVEPVPALKRLARIEARHRLVRSAGEHFVFDHNQVQEALYRGLPAPLARAYHGALGVALEGALEGRPPGGAEAVELCEHFLRGAQEPRALEYLETALDHLEKGHLHDAAAALAGRALEIPGLVQGRARFELLLRREARLDMLGRRAPERACLDEAMEVAEAQDDDLLRARARRALGAHLIAVSSNEEALGVLTEAVPLARAAGDRREECVALRVLGAALHTLGRSDEAREEFARSLVLAREIGDRDAEAAATNNIALLLYATGRNAEARVLALEGLELARAARNPRWECGIASNLGLILQRLGEVEEARGCFERALNLAREIGDRRSEANARTALGSLYRNSGRIPEARREFERGLVMHQECGNRRSEGIAMGFLAGAELNLERVGEARALNEKALAIAEETGDAWGRVNAELGLAQVELRVGRYEAVQQRARSCVDGARGLGSPAHEAMARIFLAEALLARGRLAESWSECERALAIGTGAGDREMQVVIHLTFLTLALACGACDEVRDRLAFGLAYCERTSRRLEQAALTYLQGRLQEQEGDARAAIRSYETALRMQREQVFVPRMAQTLLALGEVRIEQGDTERAQALLAEARTLAEDFAIRPALVLAVALQALLPGGDAASAERTLRACADEIPHGTRMQAHDLLWRATKDPAHLREAHRLLQHLRAHAPQGREDALLRAVPLHRAIAEAHAALG